MSDITLLDAFRQIQARCYDQPAVGLSPWVAVDDATAHTVISLMNSFLDRNTLGGGSLQFRNHPAYIALFDLARTHPWDTLFVVDEEHDTLSISPQTTSDDLGGLVRVIQEFHSPID